MKLNITAGAISKMKLHQSRLAKLLIVMLLAALVIVPSLSVGAGFDKLLMFVIYHAVLILLPIAFCVIMALRRGVVDSVILLAIGACGSGLFVYSNFWSWWLKPELGIGFSVFCYIIMFLYLVKNLKPYIQAGDLESWLAPVALWIFYSLYILSVGLAPFGTNEVLANVAQRFSHPLPIDNQLPYIFAQQIASGSISIPMIGDWLSSDRPPLQTSYFLASGAVFFTHSSLHYQVASTLLQCLWVVPLWIILRDRLIGRLAMLFALAVTMFSGFALLHGLFTWPKLLPVFFILLIFGILFDDKNSWLASWKIGGVAGGLAALAMLSHGGSLFAILGIGLTVLLWKRIPSPAFILGAISVGLVLMFTWSVYQSYIDPPGNRLLKWHLAGIVPIDERTFSQAFIDSYGALNRNEFWRLKLSNLKAILGDPMAWGGGLVRAVLHLSDDNQIMVLRTTQFFTLAAALGVFVLAPLAIFSRGDSGTMVERRLGIQLLALSACIAGVWVLLLFGPSATVIHQGTLALLVFLYVGSVLIVFSFSKYFAVALAIAHFLSVIAIYLGSGWQVEGLNADTSLYFLALFSLCLTVVTMIVGSRPPIAASNV